MQLQSRLAHEPSLTTSTSAEHYLSEVNCELYLLFTHHFFFIVFPGITQLMRSSIALRLIFKGFPGTDSLTFPLKDVKENVLNFFEVGLSAPRTEINLCC